MDPYLKAPPDLQCGAVESVYGALAECMRFRGHAGMHATEPSPGETVAWPNALEVTMTGILGPHGLKPDTPDQRRHASDYESREARRDAIELAVRALTPIIPVFAGDAIGRAIIELATELGAYIRNGEE